MKNNFNIEEKMIAFLESQDHVFQLDGKINQPSGSKIADYLFFNKKAVVELKNLEQDPKEKILKLAETTMESEDFPLVFGDYDLEKAILSTPNGESVLNDIFKKSTRMIEGILRQAKEQISSSKKLLNIDPETPGILLVLNDSFDSIPTTQIADRFNYWLNNDNQKRFYDIDFVIFIQTTYKMKNEYVIPLFIITNKNNSHRHHLIEKEIMKFTESWAHHQGHNHSSITHADPIKTEPIKETRKPETFQEFIEEKYRENRYLKNLSEEDFIKHGVLATENMFSLVLKDRKRPPKALEKIYLQQYIELHEECRLRMFDHRKIISQLKKKKS